MIEQYISQTPAQNDAENDPEKQILDLLFGHDGGIARPKPGPLNRAHNDAPANEDADDIGQRIPAQGDGHAKQCERENLGR